MGHGEGRVPRTSHLLDRSVFSTSEARAEGKGDLLRASHQSFLEGEVGRETREAVSPTRMRRQDAGAWSPQLCSKI